VQRGEARRLTLIAKALDRRPGVRLPQGDGDLVQRGIGDPYGVSREGFGAADERLLTVKCLGRINHRCAHRRNCDRDRSDTDDDKRGCAEDEGYGKARCERVSSDRFPVVEW
jgi:hypothetical protein